MDANISRLPIDAVDIEDDFWRPRRETNRTATIHYQYEQLADRNVFENFRHAATGAEPDAFAGHWFADEHAYKWLEAACYALEDGDDRLRERVDEVVDAIVAAQADDGYLQTYVQVVEPDKRWTNLAMLTELYCGGHLIEAAIAHHRATGESRLLDVAIRFVDHVESALADIDAIPGHPEIELALLRLADLTGEERYFDLAKTFVDRRGHSDRFADEFARGDEIGGHEYEEDIVEMGREFFFEDGAYDGSYAQDHRPLRDQETVEGHAVRLTYLAAAATEIAAETGDDELFAQLETLWENMITKRTYVTGGIGSTDGVEGFTEDYDLPNDTAYAETCAAIGSVFWNQRLFEATGDPGYLDLIEWTLYNAVLPGVSLSGTEFFYDNVLAADEEHSRQDWYECACCPPNLARLLATVETYVYAVDDDGLYVTQYVGGRATATVDGTDVTIDQSTDMPWAGSATIDVDAAEPTAFTLRVRIPEWAENPSVTVDGEAVGVDGRGFVGIDRTWDDQRVTVDFDLPVRPLRAHPAVEADAGRVALTRGPLVYCLEGVDHDRPLHHYAIDPDAAFETTYREDLLEGVTTLSGAAVVPAREGWDGDLYRPAGETDRTTAPFTAVPYYAWDNREAGAMAVWLRTA